MPTFNTAEEYIAYRVTCERIDTGGKTWWQVVDRFTTGDKIVGQHMDDGPAHALRDQIRDQRLAEVLRAGIVAAGDRRVEVEAQ